MTSVPQGEDAYNLYFGTKNPSCCAARRVAVAGGVLREVSLLGDSDLNGGVLRVHLDDAEPVTATSELLPLCR